MLLSNTIVYSLSVHSGRPVPGGQAQRARAPRPAGTMRSLARAATSATLRLMGFRAALRVRIDTVTAPLLGP